MTVRIGLVGWGYVSQTFHAPLIDATEGVRLTAVSSSRPDEVRAARPDVAVHASPDSLFAATDVDVVVIATPPAEHARLGEAALRAGKHVVVEKPFTITVAEAACLLQVARDCNRLLTVFHNRRWDTDTLTVSSLLQTGTLGEVALIESNFDRFRPLVRDRWRERDEPGSGQLYDLGPHLIDQALTWLGMPDAVFADAARQRAGAKADDYVELTLRYGARRVVLRAGILMRAATPRVAAYGTLGSYVKYGLDPQEDQLKAGMTPGAAGWGVSTGGERGVLTLDRDGAAHAAPYMDIPGDYRRFYTGLAAAVTGSATAPVDAEDARRVMQVIEAARTSIADGCLVRF